MKLFNNYTQKSWRFTKKVLILYAKLYAVYFIGGLKTRIELTKKL